MNRIGALAQRDDDRLHICGLMPEVANVASKPALQKASTVSKVGEQALYALRGIYYDIRDLSINRVADLKQSLQGRAGSLGLQQRSSTVMASAPP
jgi:hypothetical protein